MVNAILFFFCTVSASCSPRRCGSSKRSSFLAPPPLPTAVFSSSTFWATRGGPLATAGSRPVIASASRCSLVCRSSCRSHCRRSSPAPGHVLLASTFGSPLYEALRFAVVVVALLPVCFLWGAFFPIAAPALPGIALHRALWCPHRGSCRSASAPAAFFFLTPSATAPRR